VTLVDDQGGPVRNATVTVTMTDDNGNDTDVTCTTNSSGSCSVSLDFARRGWNRVDRVSVTITDVQGSSPPWNGQSPTDIVNRP